MYVDSQKKTTVIQGNTFTISKNKILAKLSLLDAVQSGIGTLAVLLNKGGGKKEVISKGQIKVFNPTDFENEGQEGKLGLPAVNTIQGKITKASKKGGEIIRLAFTGSNFGAREIKTNDQYFISRANKANTTISFTSEADIEILRVRVLNKGRRMLVWIRFKGDDITSIPFTISTPKGQFFSEKLGIDLSRKNPVRNILLVPTGGKAGEKDKDKKEEKKF